MNFGQNLASFARVCAYMNRDAGQISGFEKVYMMNGGVYSDLET